jgi:FdhD protein
VCGKTHLDAVLRRLDPLPADDLRIPAAVLLSLPGALRAAQPGFAACGGLHAAGLFTPSGELLAAFEDVGRHNAVDKLIGWALLRGEPTAGRLLGVSGRAGFELVQKAAVAGVPVFAAVGAASSLAVELAGRVGMTLAGFVRDGRATVYTGGQRIGGS